MVSDANGYEPQWIGEGGRQLYAGLHPAGQGGARLGLLVVPPLLHEQLRSRRLLMEVAATIGAHGIACLRFDYFGTGDSGGEGAGMDLASMREDIGVAAAALRARAGVDRLAILAFRGAAFPVASWLDRGGDADCVVFWEPILDGAGWLGELDDADAAELGSRDRYPLRRGVPVERSDRQLMGFDVSPRLRRDLADMQVGTAAWTRRTDAWGVLRPGVSLPSLSMQRVFELPPDAARIGDGTRMDGALFVSPGLRRVVDELAGALTGRVIEEPLACGGVAT